jgi:hypothetical protein
VNGVLGHRDQAVAHGLVIATRTVHRNDGDHARAQSQFPGIQAAGNRHHPNAVERAAGADRRAVIDLIRIQQICPIGIQVPRIGRQLDGGAYLIADEVDGIEVLRKPDEVAVVRVISGTAAPFAIVDIRRPRNQPEIDVVAAHDDALAGVAWSQGKR